jgi:DNA-binding GntR family transcriptional regulator
MDASDLALTREETGYLARAVLATLWDLARPLTTRELAALLQVGLGPLESVLRDIAARGLVTLYADGELVSTPDTDALGAMGLCMELLDYRANEAAGRGADGG